MLKIEKVDTEKKAQVKQFVELPYKLYNGSIQRLSLECIINVSEGAAKRKSMYQKNISTAWPSCRIL